MEIKKTEKGDLDLLLSNIRSSDYREVLATTSEDPRIAIIKTMDQSDILGTAWINGEVAFIFGAIPLSIISPIGCPWLLGTNAIKPKHVIHFMPLIQRIIGTKYSHQVNYVYVENKESIRTLRRAGFSFDEPKKFGPNGEMFMKFWRFE